MFGIERHLVHAGYINEDLVHWDFIWFIQDSVLFRVRFDRFTYHERQQLTLQGC